MASSGWWRGEGLPLQARLLSFTCEWNHGERRQGLQIPRRVDYGLRAVIYLSVQDPEKCWSIAEIARQQRVPKKFLEKIIQDLRRCGLIKSQRGACGGYTLARSPEQISFYDVIEAIEGTIAVKRTNRNGGRP